LIYCSLYHESCCLSCCSELTTTTTITKAQKKKREREKYTGITRTERILFFQVFQNLKMLHESNPHDQKNNTANSPLEAIPLLG
jgi:hypothetical protein